ncbi:MAG TPA: hypothetical protein V6D22_03510 [Candidatus Obscuribacterales bacterium]
MKKSLFFGLAAMMAVATVAPSYAADGVLGGVASLAGSTCATVVGVPEGILVDSLWRMPMKMWHGLASGFGDEHGFEQNVAGAVIGVPVGFLWGIPEGAIRGGRHGMTTGWEKPFSTDSFVCIGDEK